MRRVLQMAGVLLVQQPWKCALTQSLEFSKVTPAESQTDSHTPSSGGEALTYF